MIRVAIVEDDPAYQRQLRGYLNQYEMERGQSFQITSFESGHEIAYHYEADYDLILIYPNWWGDLPMALYSFFDTYDFSGKTVYVSVTHGGSGFSGGISTIEALEPEARVVEGLSIRAGDVPDAEDEIRQWAQGAGS